MRAFTAPSLAELSQTSNSSEIMPLLNSQSPSGVLSVLVGTGSNSALKPQTATEWTASVTIAPGNSWVSRHCKRVWH